MRSLAYAYVGGTGEAFAYLPASSVPLCVYREESADSYGFDVIFDQPSNFDNLEKYIIRCFYRGADIPEGFKFIDRMIYQGQPVVVFGAWEKDLNS